MWRYSYYIILALLVSILPFVSHFGLNQEYEYALASSYLALSFVPLWGIFVPLNQTLLVSSPKTLAFEIFWIFLFSPLIALLPGSLRLLNQSCLCSPMGFYFWMVIQWLPSWILAHAFAQGLIRLRLLGKAKTHLIGVLVALYLLLTLVLIITIWFFPQKRSALLLTGFLHGPIYDNWIVVDHGIMFTRLAHLFLAIFLISIAWLNKQRLSTIISAMLTFILWISFTLQSTKYDSTTFGKNALDGLFNRTLKNQHFTLHYVDKQQGFVAPIGIKRLFRDTQFHMGELKKIFNGGSDHIDIYIYPSQDQKKLWFGGGATDVADVFTPSIHITESSWPHSTLRHELVHAVASEFGFYGLGFHPNMAFTEGLAEALAPRERDISLDDGAASLFVNNRLPDINDIFSLFFWTESGLRAYTFSGSFINFLIERYGVEKVKRLYRGENWNKVFKKSTKKILNEWKKKILTDYDNTKFNLSAEAIYRYPGVLYDLCPHSKADLRKPRSYGPFLRLRQPIAWEPQQDYWPWRLILDPHDKYAHMMQWGGEIAKITAQRAVSIGKLITWRDVIRRARVWPPKTIEDIEMAILESDLERLISGRQFSLDLLKKINEFALSKGIGDDLLRSVQARMMLEETLQENYTIEWRQYLAGWTEKPPPPLTSAEPWILSYLRLRKGDSTILNLDRLVFLLNQEKVPKHLAETFAIEWYKFLGLRFMEMEDYSDAKNAYQIAAELAPKGMKAMLMEHARRAEFYSSLGSIGQSQ